MSAGVRRKLLLYALLLAGTAFADTSTKVHVFYYPWYGAPSVSRSWRHWPQNGRTPPLDVASNYYPVLGAYDSGDSVNVLPQHMQWIQRAGIGVLSVSWWGQNS